jgi:hypothetical protein
MRLTTAAERFKKGTPYAYPTVCGSVSFYFSSFLECSAIDVGRGATQDLRIVLLGLLDATRSGRLFNFCSRTCKDRFRRIADL